MSVLACFYKAGHSNALFRDPDFFISYFKTFMFDDLKFVESILREDRSLGQFQVDVHRYLQDRLHLFLTMDHAVSAERLNKHFAAGRLGGSNAASKSTGTSVEAIPGEFFELLNTAEADRGRVALNQRVRALYRFGSLNEDSQEKNKLRGSISHLLAHLVSTRSTMRLASRKVWIVNHKYGTGLVETEAEYNSLAEGNPGSISPIEVGNRVPDGPALLECAAADIRPFFVLRAVEENEPGPVLATFGHALRDSPATPPLWSHAKTTQFSALSASILQSDKDMGDADLIQNIADLHSASKRELRSIYEPAMMFHHLHNQPLTVEFLKEGFKGVLGDRHLVKALAMLTIFSFMAVPEKLQVDEQRSRWRWLVSVGELTTDFDEAVTTLVERGREAGWNLVVRINPDMAMVLPC
jgi:hypothetical protein